MLIYINAQKLISNAPIIINFKPSKVKKFRNLYLIVENEEFLSEKLINKFLFEKLID